MFARSLTLIAGILLLAGCLSAAPDDTPTDETQGSDSAYLDEIRGQRLPIPDYDFTKAISVDHGGDAAGHANPAFHLGSFGLDIVGYHPLNTVDDPQPSTLAGDQFTAVDTWENYVCITQWRGAGGASIVDIADPSKPRLLSSAPSGMDNSDCMFTDDGKYLLVAAYMGASPGVSQAPPPVGDAGAQGVTVYDVSDKSNPRYLFHDSQGAGIDGYHNVFTAQIEGTHYVFQTYTGHILALDPEATRLRMVSTIQPADHDLWVGRHPVTGGWVLVTGAGQGTAVFDVNDPSNPVRLGEWAAEGATTGWHRQWPVDGVIDGRALMVVAGEFDEGFYTVLDFTDPTDLIELGNWSIPVPGARLAFSAHEFEIWNGYVVCANYHGGLWLFDVASPERMTAPATLGFHQLGRDPLDAGGIPGTPGTSSMSVWGAAFDERGYAVTADSASGLYVLSFDGTIS